MWHRGVLSRGAYGCRIGEAAWAQTRDILARCGTDHAAESEIAGAVEVLRDKAGHGAARPRPARRRPAWACTRATAQPDGLPTTENLDPLPPETSRTGSRR